MTELMDALLASVGTSAGYALVGLAWVIIYRTTGLLNFATGSLLVLAAFGFSTLAASLPIGLAALAVLLLSAGGGVAIYSAALRPLAGQPTFSAVVLTLGLSIVISSVVSIVWGRDNRVLPPPFVNETYHVGESLITKYQIAAVLACVVLFSVTLLFLKFSRFGLQMRACAESPLLASQSGVRIGAVFALAWAIAMVAICIGGISTSYTTGILTTAHAALGLRAVAPALIGGLDSVGGVLFGAVIAALVENLAVVYIGAEVQSVALFLVLLVVLLIRPYGLFGTPEVRRV